MAFELIEIAKLIQAKLIEAEICGRPMFAVELGEIFWELLRFAQGARARTP